MGKPMKGMENGESPKSTGKIIIFPLNNEANLGGILRFQTCQ